MAGTKANQVPAMVAAHQDYLRTHTYQRFAGGFIASAWQSSTHTDLVTKMKEIDGSLEEAAMAQGRQMCKEEADILNISTLFHVTDSMLEVSKYAAVKLDDYDRWSAEVLPAPNGFMVFERPLLVEDVWGHLVAYHAVSWRRVKPPSREEMRADKSGRMPTGGEIAYLDKELFRFSRGLLPKRLDDAPVGDMITVFHFYTDVTDMTDSYNRNMRAAGTLDMSIGRWQLCHFSAMIDGGVVGPMTFTDQEEILAAYREKYEEHLPFTEEEDHSTFEGFIPNSSNVLRILYSIFVLMDQTVVVLSEETDRRLARRIRGKHRPPPMVTVIRLRRPESFGEYDKDTGAWLTYRSLTRCHYRRQHYKDGTTKKIFIHAYWRGPEDGPVWQPQRVTTLER